MDSNVDSETRKLATQSIVKQYIRGVITSEECTNKLLDTMQYNPKEDWLPENTPEEIRTSLLNFVKS